MHTLMLPKCRVRGSAELLSPVALLEGIAGLLDAFDVLVGIGARRLSRGTGGGYQLGEAWPASRGAHIKRTHWCFERLGGRAPRPIEDRDRVHTDWWWRDKLVGKRSIGSTGDIAKGGITGTDSGRGDSS